MHRILTLLLLSSVLFHAQAQVIVNPITLNHGNNWLSYRFPFIQSKQPLVAQKINLFLQQHLLDNKKVITDSNKIFAASRYINDNSLQSGYSFIDYTVVVNNARLLSLQFDLESTGAYSTGFNDYYNFDNHTGELVTASSIFNPRGLKALEARLLKERKKRVVHHITELKTEISNEDSLYIPETFKECLDQPREDVKKIFIKPKSIVFYKEHCFPHVALPYEADLDLEISLKELLPYLSAYGKKLLGIVSLNKD